jgi:outer membrane protein assembly factor BamB
MVVAALLGLVALGCRLPAGRSATLEQVISRENPAFNCPLARLVIGRDGLVYLCSGGNSSYVLRLTRDGRDKFGGTVVYAAANATANADEIVATANGHFAHKVSLYDKGLHNLAGVDEFLVSDQVGWDAPAHVEAGAGGDFYGIDQHRDRIVRLSPAGKLVKAYPIPHEPASHGGLIQDFRVCEKTEAFYLLTRSGPLRCVGFDGKPRWVFNAGIGWGEPSNAGGFDVDDGGSLYVIERHGDTVKKVSAEGKLLGTLKLQMGDHRPKPTDHGFTDLRVRGDDLLLKRQHATELFQRYDLDSGALKGVIGTDHERLTVTFPGEVWTAGQAVPFDIQLTAGERKLRPHWRVWARTLGALDYREFKLADGKLQVPADAAGILQVKVTPELDPWQRGAASEYLVRTWVEVRQPGMRGSVCVATPGNRTWYGRGEEVPFAVLVRTAAGDKPAQVAVRLLDDGHTLAQTEIAVKPGANVLHMTLPKALTAGLRPGRYLLTATATGLTAVPQPLMIGPGLHKPSVRMVQYGDYGPLYPHADVWDAPDKSAARAAQAAKLGVNLVVDRLGAPDQAGQLSADPPRAQVADLIKRLEADPLAPSAEKAVLAPALLQTVSADGAAGIEQMAILMMNDAGLPLGGPGFDPSKPDQLTATIRKVTDELKPYPAFRGLTWSSNWWVFQNRGALAAKTPEEKTAYEKALKHARDSGAWDPVLDRVSGYRLGYAVEAQDLFHKTLKATAPGLVTASAYPHRNVEAYPPVTLSNVDEADLQAQWEQIGLPYHVPHGVDFYKRPGKQAWTHPEIWNDAGTGDQILPTLFQGLMRGADGVGFSGPLPPWGAIPEDPRLSYSGTASVYRALGGVLRTYGPWLSTLEDNDQVAFVCSGRMFRIDEWGNTMGTHFARLMEAYVSCLHAHHPVRYVFVEDLKPETLKRFKAILVVGQTVEMEPALAEALKQAKAAGVTVFHDGTCRPSLVKEFTPLGIAFDKFEKDRHPASDDAAYWRFPAYCRANVPALAKALDPVAPAPARVDNDEVFLSERRSEEGRYLFVVNNTTPALEPGHLWRVSLCVATRIPVQASVRLPGEPRFVYDAFAGKRVEPDKGVVQADCRSLPARVFVSLPAAIEQIVLVGPEAVQAGRASSWRVYVEDADGRPIRGSIPIRVRLLRAGGAVLDEQFAAAGSQGARVTLTSPLNGPAGAEDVEATELLTGKTVHVPLTVEVPLAPAPLGPVASAPVAAPKRGNIGAPGKDPARSLAPAEGGFGPHVRDLTLTNNGSLAVLNTMNWDHNLYAVDVDTGKVRWRQRFGHYFAFAPEALQSGFAVQGFDFQSAQGYHLYLADSDGRPERRFALYGLPGRLPHRFVPALVRDRINNFAVPEDGRWVASAGDLGLAVWARDGRLLWSQDWWKTQRHTATLAALGPDTLLVVEGTRATGYAADSGKQLWQLNLASTGEVRTARATRDGRTCALLATTDGGRIFVLRDGKLLQTLPTGGNALELSADGSRIAVVMANQLKLYALDRGLEWILPGDDTLHFPRFAPDGRRLVATSDLGTVYVVDLAGKVLLERDLGALVVPAWLPDGDLLLATWMGTVCRLDAHYAERWRTRLQPAATDIRGKLLAHDGTPTTRITSWGNAEAEAAPLTPNLLSPRDVVIKLKAAAPHIQLVRDPAALVDGKPDPPPEPWLDWGDVGWFAETSPFNYLLLDTYRTQLRVTGITLAEDPAHPESWLRDATLEYWDAGRERWVFVQPLLSNAAVHTHKLARPIEAARFRIVLPWGLCGNLRLAEIVLHGEKLGPSHPDVIAKRPVAVLFDEGDDLKESLVAGHNGLTFQFEGAYSGGRSLHLRGDATVYPPFQPPFGHVLPNWDFPIAEQPEPGQYRYLQFAWRALAPETKGMLLQLGAQQYGDKLDLYAGTYTPGDGVRPKKVADAPPRDWQVVRVDLWEVFKKPVRIQSLALGSRGGAAAFDQIVLGRTEKDLPSPRK